MSRPSLARASTLNFTSSAISLIAALVVSVALARRLEPAGFGVYALVMAVIAFTFLIARLGVPDTAARYTSELAGSGDAPGRSGGLIGTLCGRALITGSVSGAAASLLLIVISGPVSTLFHRPAMHGYLLLGALLLVPMVTLSVLQGILRGLQQYRYLMQVNLLTSPLWVAGTLLAMAAGAGIPGVLLATLVVELLNLAALTWRAHRLVGIRFNRRLPPDLAARLRRYNLSLALLVVLDLIVWQRSELLFLGRFSTSSQASFYAVPFALVEKLTDLLPGSVLGVLLPGLAFLGGSSNPVRVALVFKQAIAYLAVLTVPLCAIGILFASPIIRMLYGPGFEPATIILQVLLVSMVFGVLGQAARTMLLNLEQQEWLVRTGAAAAAVGIAFDIVLIPHWGALGAAVANTIMQAAWTLAIGVPVWRHLYRHPSHAVMTEAVAS